MLFAVLKCSPKSIRNSAIVFENISKYMVSKFTSTQFNVIMIVLLLFMFVYFYKVVNLQMKFASIKIRMYFQCYV